MELGNYLMKQKEVIEQCVKCFKLLEAKQGIDLKDFFEAGNKKNYKLFSDIKKKGLYAFYDGKHIVYIGKGGDSETRLLKERILQELHYDGNGDTGATLSKNIRSRVNGHCINSETEFYEYIRNWKLKVVDYNDDELLVSLDLVEAFCIELFETRKFLNIK